MTTTSQSPNPPSRNFFTTKSFRILVATAVLLCGGLFVFKLLKENTTLSFSFLLDGKPLSVGTAPTVQVDGKPFTSGLTIAPGPHKLAADLQIAEPFVRRVWVFYGDKNLGALSLESSKGSLLVSVNPSPAGVILRRGTETVGRGDAPLTLENLSFGYYELEIKRGEYKETQPVRIQGRQRTEAKINLNLGGANLSSDPADAEFQLSGSGRQWDGKLPILIVDVPVGDYRFIARRKGWEIDTNLSIGRGVLQTNKIEFPYGLVEVTSDPTGLAVTTNGVDIGKTPLTLRELRPGQYKLTVTDGENDLMVDLSVGAKETAKHAFVFRYGKAQLESIPAGASVIRKGREAGKTPLELERILAGETTVVVKLDGYVTTNFALHVAENQTVTTTATLISELYLQAMNQTREALDAKRFGEARKFIDDALRYEPNDPAAIKLLKDVDEEERKGKEALIEIERKGEQALGSAEAAFAENDFARAAKLAKDALTFIRNNEQAKALFTKSDLLQPMTFLDYEKVINDCVIKITDDGQGNILLIPIYRLRIDVFNQRYLGKEVAHIGKVAKVDKSGMIILKNGGAGFPEVWAYPRKDNPYALVGTVQKGNELIITGTISEMHEPALFTPIKLFLKNVTIVERRDKAPGK